jgi:hypothetical protein
MIVLNWQPLGVYRRPAGDEPWLVSEPWLVAWENLPQAAKYLRLKTTGRWTPMSGLPECGPDGLVGQTFPADRLFVSDCAVGALIGRVGGSSATLKGGATPNSKGGESPAKEGGGESKSDAPAAKADDDPSKPFAAGSYTVIKLPDNAIGPLLIGFNILLRPISVRTLEITIDSSS